MQPETSETTGYTARFGFDRRTVLVLGICAVFVTVCIWLPTDPSAGLGPPLVWIVKVVGVLFFGAGGLVFAVAVARGGLALRVDHEGITVGKPRIPQPGMTGRVLHLAWEDVADVVLFDQYHVGGRQQYVGLRLRSGVRSPGTTFDPDSRLWTTNRGLMSHVPEDILLRSRPVSGWRLDEQRLCATVARYAPDVDVVRLDETGAPQPVDLA